MSNLTDSQNKKKNYSLKYTFVYAVFPTANAYCYRFLILFDTSNTFIAFRSINTIDNKGEKKQIILLLKYRATYFVFYRKYFEYDGLLNDFSV
jgi:hypothetical protein